MSPGAPCWHPVRVMRGYRRLIPSARLLAMALVVVGVGAVGFWAGRATLATPEIDTPTSAPPVYSVTQGTLSRQLSFVASAGWERNLAGRGGTQGVVTQILVRGDNPVAEGARLFDVNERPVFVAQGRIPLYADLDAGSNGQVVAQLQAFLNRQGFYGLTPSGSFDSATRAAVLAWQRDVGVTADGRVQHGDLIFVPGPLPARVVVDPEVRVGTEVSTNGVTVQYLSSAPQFDVKLAEAQRDLVPLDAKVRVKADGHVWRGKVASAEQIGDGQLVLHLSGRGGAPICAPNCDAVDTTGISQFPVQLVVVPHTRGPIVPAAALRTDSSGGTFVVTEVGNQVPVAVQATDGGWSVVTGLDVGARVLLFGGDA